MSLESGKRLGPYEIVGPIGAGGTGEVYKANDTRLGRTVAIKVLPEHLAGSPELKQRFEREAKAISQLNHPHICTLYDVGQQDGVDYLVMEHIEGETLAEKLTKGPPTLELALDYGLAKLIVDTRISDSSDAPTQAQQDTLTREQTVVGALRYMAPEQLEELSVPWIIPWGG